MAETMLEQEAVPVFPLQFAVRATVSAQKQGRKFFLSQSLGLTKWCRTIAAQQS
jgi:hypothetical protein